MDDSINLHFWYLRWSGWQRPVDFHGVEAVWMATSRTFPRWLEVRKQMPESEIRRNPHGRQHVLEAWRQEMRASLVDALTSGKGLEP